MKKIKKVMAMVLTFSLVLSLFPANPLGMAKATNPAPPTGYVSDANNIMAYKIPCPWGGTVDVQGYGPTGINTFGWLQTTCGNGGFYTMYKYTNGSMQQIGLINGEYIDTTRNIKVKFNPSLINLGRYIKLSYEVTNNNSVSQTISLGAGADVQIGNDDSAPITMFEDGTGFSMKNQYTNAQFNFYGKDAYGVTNVDAFWYGYYGAWRSNVLNQINVPSFSGDSGMCFSWQDRTIAAGETKVFSVIMGIGPANKAPQLSNVSFVGDSEVYPGESITITGCVADTDNMEDTKVYCSIEGETETEIYAFPGTTLGDFNSKYKTSVLFPGTYTLNVYAMDGAGGISNVEKKNITVKSIFSFQPTSINVVCGNTAMFRAMVDVPCLVQWQVSENNGTTWSDISGETSLAYVTPATSESMQGYKYRCVTTLGTSNVATLTIINISQTITTTESITKIFGDADFNLSATAKTAVTYAIKSGSDVVSLDGNKVHILKSGTAEITATAPADTTYDEATVDITITVSKQDTTFPSGGVSVNATYTKTLTLADITLPDHYRFKDATTVPQMGLSTYPVIYNPNPELYNDVEGTANVTINKAVPKTPVFPTASALTYGDKLINSVLINGNGDGSFDWTNPETIPTVTNNGYSVTFVPNDTDHYDYTGINLTQLVAVSVAKADPEYTVPTLSNVTYSPNLTLSTVTLPEGWNWDNGSTILVAGSRSYSATFTPVDSANYNVILKNISLTVDKAIPTVETPSPEPVIYRTNLKLSDIALDDGWIWELPNTSLTVASSGEFKATYTPADTDNYLSLNDVAIPVTINKAMPQAIVFPTASTITYGEY